MGNIIYSENYNLKKLSTAQILQQYPTFYQTPCLRMFWPIYRLSMISPATIQYLCIIKFVLFVDEYNLMDRFKLYKHGCSACDY